MFFVLPPESAAVDKEAVVRVVRDDLGQGPWFSGLARSHLARPASGCRVEEKDTIVFIVREDAIEMTIVVEINMAETDDFLAVLQDPHPAHRQSTQLPAFCNLC